MRKYFALFLSLAYLVYAQPAHAAIETNLDSVNVSGFLKPKTSGVDFGTTAKRWDAWVDNLNTSLGEGFAAINASGSVVRIPYGASTTYLRGDGSTQTLNTTAVAEGTNLYYTDARARAAISATAPITYNNTTGVIECVAATGSLAGCLSAADWTTFNSKEPGDADLTALAASASTGFSVRTASNTWAFRSIGVVAPIAITNPFGTAGDPSISCVAASGSVAGCLSATDWNTFNGKQAGDADLTALAALSGTDTIYYRSAADTWTPVTIGSGLNFTAGTLAAAGGGSGGSTNRTVRALITPTYTLALSDGYDNGDFPLIAGSSTTSISITIPPNSSVAFPIGDQVDVDQMAAGQVCFTPGSGVTFVGDPCTASTYDRMYAVKIATDTWNISGQTTPLMSATGGTITTDGNYKVHDFTTSGTFTPAVAGLVDYVCFAGGGAGGGQYNSGTSPAGGGGGAGGYLTASGVSVTATAYTVTIGAGGVGTSSNARGTNGGNTTVSAPLSLTLVGGGAAGAYDTQMTGNNGGSGGGGAYNGVTHGNGTALQGNNGGDSFGSQQGSGGGGGCGAVGQTAPSGTAGGNGGTGCSSSISGASVCYAGGGGGSANTTAGTATCGGGAGVKTGSANAGTANLGGGGGGVYGSVTAGGNGGSGRCIFRYRFQ